MTQHMHGPAGFTREAIEALKPYAEETRGGLFYFDKVPKEVLFPLLEKMPEGYNSYRHNLSPTIEQFMSLAPKGSLLEGFVVTQEREDERVTIDGILIPFDEARHFIDDWTAAFPNADECEVKDGHLRLWWD